MTTAREFIDNSFDRFTQELLEWLRIPSVSALPEHAEDVRDAASWVRDKLVAIGFSDACLIETDGHPLVYAESLEHSDGTTLLVYGHYDVQPADMEDGWASAPFEPEIRNGNIYGRGTTDDKGQLMVVLAALESLIATTGGLPINVKILLEGEEESGGAGIDRYVRAQSEKLKADGVLICDTHMVSEEQPSLINGLRGILYAELEVRGAASDLHSGSYGGVAPNPLHALCLLFSRLKGEDGVITIPELAGACEVVSGKEKKFFDDDPLAIEDELKKEMGVSTLVGDADVPPLERLGVRPTLELHGIRGGFTGEGAKTVIPATALAKFSLRLPANLDAEDVFTWLRAAVRQEMPAGYTFDLRNLHSGGGVSVKADDPLIRAASASLERIYQKEPVFMREGGSIPVAALFYSILEVPVVLMGFGLPDDGAHGPDEKFSLGQFRRGMHTVVDFLEQLGAREG